MNNTKVLDWVCPDCGKQIVSLYKEQLESNRASHEANCEKKKR